MSQLQFLRAAVSLHDVASLLQFTPSALAYVLYKTPIGNRYREFQVPKRGGGMRLIQAPCPQLKLLQTRLSTVLQDCIHEIDAKHNIDDQLAHGFKRNRSILTNAAKHRKRQYVFNIDLSDFFPSINFGRVRGFFIKDANFMLDKRVATILAQIACHQNALPQGSPCSPTISNLIGRVLDIRLCNLAAKNGCTYSRYADDISFSTNKPIFPTTIAVPDSSDPHKWNVGKRLEELVARSGFTINAQKTRMQYKDTRQDVTGLVVNRKVNIRTEYRRTARAMVHHLLKSGEFQVIRAIPDPNGVPTRTKVKGTVPQLHGMLGHINWIDVSNYKADLKADIDQQRAIRTLRSKEKLFRKFLIFENFHLAPAPVVVCEGKTDNTYLSTAIKKLAPKYPGLATVSADGKSAKLTIRILNTQSATGRVLQLGTGTGEIPYFINDFLRQTKTFTAPGTWQPIILLVDNDSGAKDILSTVNRITNHKHDRTKAYIHVAANLYLVLTPLIGTNAISSIEDFFPAKVRNVNIGGKTFSAENNFDSANHFGKEIFSQYVRDNASRIDFSGFSGILDRIIGVINDHHAKLIPPHAAAMAAMP